MCGLAAGAWLGAAEAPTKLVTVGFSPFIISLGMVAGVFAARWTVPEALKGTSYGMDESRVAAALRGEEAFAKAKTKRHWWEALVVLAAIGIFVWLGLNATRQQIVFSVPWMIVLGIASLVALVVCGVALWRRTRFS